MAHDNNDGPQLDPFLIAGAAAGTRSISDAWTAVLRSEGLGSPGVVAAADAGGGGGGGGGVVTLVNAAIGARFSSAGNTDYFLGTPPDDEDPDDLGSAWMGDQYGSAVMILAPDASLKPPQSLEAVLKALQFDLSSPKLSDLVHIIDASNAVNISVSPPPMRVSDAYPTPAVWCVTNTSGTAKGDTQGTQGYLVRQRPSFDVSVGDVVKEMVDWVAKQLGVTLDASKFENSSNTSRGGDGGSGSGSGSAPGKLHFTVTATRTTTYSPVAPFGAVPGSSEFVASFAFPMGDLRLTVAVGPGTAVNLTLTPNPASAKDLDLLTLVRDAIGTGSPQSPPNSVLPQTAADDNNPDPIVAFLGKLFRPWYLTAGFPPNIFTNLPSEELVWGVGFVTVLQAAGGRQPLIFGFTYDSSTSTFFGELLTRDYFLDGFNLRSLPYDSSLSVTNIVLKALGADSIEADIPSKPDLWAIVAPAGVAPPSEIPHCLAGCNITLRRTVAETGKSCYFGFAATLQTAGDETNPSAEAGSGDAAPTGLIWESAGIFVELSTVSTPASSEGAGAKATSLTTHRVLASSTLELAPPVHRTDLEPALVDVRLSYDDTSGQGSWLLQGSVKNLSVRLLASFFDVNSQEGAMAVLGGLNLRSLDMTYAYTGGVSSSFFIHGVLVLGGLSLDLSWQNVNKSVVKGQQTAYAAAAAAGPPPAGASRQLEGGQADNKMLFEAVLRADSQLTTLGKVVGSIIPGAEAAMPSFVADITVDPAGTGAPLVSLTYSDDSKTGSILTVNANLAGFGFSFVQFKTMAKAAKEKDPNGPAATAVPASTKRILRFECDKMPSMDRVPIIKELPQPFDSLQYVWVTDTQETAGLRGVTKNDILNMPADVPAFQYKQTKVPAKGTGADIVLATGHHFIVVVGGSVILDHVFGGEAAKPAPASQKPAANIHLVGPLEPRLAAGAAPPPTRLAAGAATGDTGPPPDPSLKDTDDSTEAKPTKGAAVLKVGPLSVSAIGFQVASGHLLIALDATLALGALSLSVLGFTIGIDLSTVHLNDLESLSVHAATEVLDALQVSLHGLAVGIERGPLTLAGIFEHLDDDTAEIYRGGISVGFKAWQVLAVGEYKAVRATAVASGYRAVFVYGKLDGPLLTVEFATISGVRLGFGYNYLVRMPALDELYRFPLISDAGLDGAGNDPMKVLAALEGGDKPFVASREGSMWFAAGMTITAFDALTLTAVLIFDINTVATTDKGAGVVIALLADGVLQMEPMAVPDNSLFYMELVIKIEFNFVQGYISADAALAPASHVYVPQARLAGQGSFYSWFGTNPHAGDWVASVGGYARNYTPPPHYPTPDRLQLSFTVGDAIHIVGSGYVAVTPRVVMAGGSLHLSLDVGPVSAYADLTLDAFIQFKPFHFRATMSLSVGVECSIDILFIHIHISIHIGADLALWGPHDFGGAAYVDFWFFGFTINFGTGENPAARDPIDIDAFLDMIRSPGPDSAPRPTDSTLTGPENADVAIHKWTVEQGLMPARTPAPAKGSQTFPSTGTDTEWDVDAASLVMRVDVDFALTAVQLTDVDEHTNKTALRTVATVPNDIYCLPMHSGHQATSTLAITVEKDEVEQGGWRAELVTKAGAPSIWSRMPWDPNNDPLHVSDRGPPPESLRDGKNGPPSIDLVQGVRLLAPEPVRMLSKIVQFDVVASGITLLQGSKPVPAEAEDRAFDAVIFDAQETGQTKRWEGFGHLMVEETNASGGNLDDVRTSIAAGAAAVLGWANRPITASLQDLDADHDGWVLKGKSVDRLARGVATQWGELPMISASA